MKTVTIRALKRGRIEETLAPGDAVRVRKNNGKVFELRRLKEGPRPSQVRMVAEAFRMYPGRASDPKVDGLAEEEWERA